MTVLEGLYVGEVFQLDQPVIIIGRDRDTQITIIEDGVSRQHVAY
ncbi:MAG: FHA domain-containing protein [Bdellovibrionota bacterium]